MPAPTAPNVAPVLPWDKISAPPRAARKKSNPLMVVALVALVVLCASGVWRSSHQTSETAWVQVVAAERDIPAGARLTYTSLRYVHFPKQFYSREMSGSLSDVAGHIAKTYIPQGEPIQASMVFSTRYDLAHNLETDERAITLQLDDDALVDHTILPDDRVDILVVSTKDGNKYTKTICQNARVLLSAPKEQILARHISGSAANKITLAVRPDAAEAISEAAEVGKVRLVLRNRLAATPQHLFGVSQDDLLPACAFVTAKKTAVASIAPVLASVPAAPALAPGLAIAPPPPFLKGPNQLMAPPPSPIAWMVEVFSGNKKESVSVPQL